MGNPIIPAIGSTWLRTDSSHRGKGRTVKIETVSGEGPGAVVSYLDSSGRRYTSLAKRFRLPARFVPAPCPGGNPVKNAAPVAANEPIEPERSRLCARLIERGDVKRADVYNDLYEGDRLVGTWFTSQYSEMSIEKLRMLVNPALAQSRGIVTMRIQIGVCLTEDVPLAMAELVRLRGATKIRIAEATITVLRPGEEPIPERS